MEDGVVCDLTGFVDCLRRFQMRKIIWMGVALAVLMPVAFSQKSAFTISDLYKIKSLGDPQISPDSRRIAFTVNETFLEEGKSNTEIYIMDADGGNLRRMTNNPSGDFHPRWSPDGKSLLFISTRKNGSQAWLIPVDGGEPRQITNISTGVGDLAWTANGKGFIFTSTVFPECGSNDDANKKIDDSMSNGPLKAHMADRLLYRHWTSWSDGRRDHTFVYNMDNDTYLDLTPGDFDAPAFSLSGASLAIAADGQEVCVASNHDANEAETTNKDLFVVPIASGAAKNITDENEAYDGNPAYSPDGRYIAYLTQKIPIYEADRFRLAIYDRKTGVKTVLTEAFDNWVDSFVWAPDSQSIYFTAEVKGSLPMYNVYIDSQVITPIINVKTIDDFDVSPDGKFVVFVRRSVGEPREIWRANTDGKELKRLTFCNKSIEDTVDIRPAEELWIPSPTGKDIHTFLVKPHNFDPSKKYPLILNVHGGPQSQWLDGFRGDWQVYPGAGYIVAFPNPHGSTGYGQAFTEAISKDWAGKVYEDVMAVADFLETLPYVDKDRMGAMGWSYGGYMMMWMEGHTNRFKAIAAMMGVYDLCSKYGATEELWFPEWDLDGTPWDSEQYTKWSPSMFVKNFRTPCLVITGERDYRVPYTQSLQFFTALQKQKVPSRLIVFANDGHWPDYVKSMPFYYNAHLDWFHKYLGGAPAPYDMLKMQRNQAFEKK